MKGTASDTRAPRQERAWEEDPFGPHFQHTQLRHISGLLLPSQSGAAVLMLLHPRLLRCICLPLLSQSAAVVLMLLHPRPLRYNCLLLPSQSGAAVLLLLHPRLRCCP